MLLTTCIEVSPILELLYHRYRRSILQVGLICAIVIIYAWRLLLLLLMIVIYDEHAVVIVKFMRLVIDDSVIYRHRILFLIMFL